MFKRTRVWALVVCLSLILISWSYFSAWRSRQAATALIAALIQRYDGPRNLTEPSIVDYSQNGQSRFVDDLLAQKTDGFFVEAGAYNGEELSNTLFFEKERGWTGLLVEPDPWNFYALQKRRRNVFSIQCCLSRADVIGDTIDFKQSDTMGRIVSAGDRRILPGIYTTARCFPLGLILKSLGRRHVDFLSLDVEGHELEVLETFPFDDITIDVMCVEFRHVDGGREKLTSLLVSKGYRPVKELGDDLIFRRSASN